jgi:hypothetical protein
VQLGKCDVECKTAERAAERIVGEHDTDIAEVLYTVSGEQPEELTASSRVPPQQHCSVYCNLTTPPRPMPVTPHLLLVCRARKTVRSSATGCAMS